MADSEGHSERLTGTGEGGSTSPGNPASPTGPDTAATPGPLAATPTGTSAPTSTESPAPISAAEGGTLADRHEGGRAIPPTPQAVVDMVHRIEASEGLDRPAGVVEKVANAVARPGAAHDALTGKWLGHALHPLMTDIPLGMWMSASLLDLVGGRASRKASRRLVGLGIVAAVPTAATGLAEWLHVDRASRRVGVVHANSNSLGLVLYTASYLARRRGHHMRGAVLGIGGGLAATFGGYLGAHLTIARKAGTRDDRFVQPAGSDGSGREA